MPVIFQPTTGKTYSGTLSIVSNKTGGASQMAIGGVGLDRVLRIGGNLKFGKVKVRKKKAKTLTLSNLGNSPPTVQRLVLPSGFKGGFSGVIRPGETRKIKVVFKPKKKKKYKGRISVIANSTAGTATKAILGKGK